MPLDPSIYNPLLNMPNWAGNAVNAGVQGYQLGSAIKEAPMRSRLLEAQTQAAEGKVLSDQENFQLTDMATDAMQIKKLAQVDPVRAQVALDERIKKITDRGGDPSDTMAVRELLTAGRMDEFNAELDAPIEAARQRGLLGQTGSAATREFEAKAAAAGLKPGTPEYERAAQVDLGLAPRAGSITGQERIATDPTLTQGVAESQATIEGAKSGAQEQAKSDVQLAMKPKIQSAIKEAETLAASRGEAISEYGRAKAALPGLQEVSNKLKTLADIATYTVGGKAFDEMVKQLGFGATEGATARVKMASLVDNQILPLLRDTFGAAFTKAEGDSLRATLLDIDASPEAKKATIDTFLEQKVRNLEAKERELGIDKSAGSFTSSSGIQFTVE